MRIYVTIAIMLIFVVLPQSVFAQVVVQTQSLRVGNIYQTGSGGAVVKIEADGTVSQGSNQLAAPITARNGTYQVTGIAGNVDISVTNITSCSASATVDGFAALWNGTGYADISTTPIAAAAFDGNEILSLGVRISYGAGVSLGNCFVSFDLNVNYS
ncbi:MAG: hypothetical protein MK052_07335 [Alphaproteobacteria bacterium]|nr:hypothetical protein [Alphaproteobacteria bacterium]